MRRPGLRLRVLICQRSIPLAHTLVFYVKLRRRRPFIGGDSASVEFRRLRGNGQAEGSLSSRNGMKAYRSDHRSPRLNRFDGHFDTPRVYTTRLLSDRR